ncbi:nicotinamide N-methyltransferase-like protein [Lasiosphaeria hispida]|uniref:Protein N-terminal and lysine N-methyltransferase EFM7 n=1 Tax=Lasiosphaeria hispida TaxID=260671 RepID=A0AAJ0MCU9_9PEZI|nr:nicotinamide N-methyltransferase-like protein [Lasiosphaeria hispida]
MGALFDDPEDFYPPSPPPTVQTYTTAGGAVIDLHLVGHSPLEAHHLWNGARVVAAHFEASPDLVRGRSVLELGAGAGLPSIVAAALGAAKVVMTDFPDPDLLQTMWRNISGCALIPRAGEDDGPCIADGYVWGAAPAHLLAHLGGSSEPDTKKFDILILADLLFRHSEHHSLLRSIATTMARTTQSMALVVFTSYRPWLQHKDLAFFDRARAQGFVVEKLFEKKMDRPLFENDPGDEEVRKTVTGWAVRWPEAACQGEGLVKWPLKEEVVEGRAAREE